MVHAEERAVQSDVFGAYRQVDGLMQGFRRARYAGAGDLSPVAEGEEAELLFGASLGFEVADADGLIELRGAVGVDAHCFSLLGCARALVVPGWWFKSKPNYFTCQVFCFGVS